MQANSVTEVKVNADAITNAKTEFTPGLTIKGDGSSADGKLILNCSQNSHGVSIAGPAHSAGQSYNLVLPTSVGSNGQVLATNGNANNQLSWVSAQETKPTVARCISNYCSSYSYNNKYYRYKLCFNTSSTIY